MAAAFNKVARFSFEMRWGLLLRTPTAAFESGAFRLRHEGVGLLVRTPTAAALIQR
jgi:hypothetical protein